MKDPIVVLGEIEATSAKAVLFKGHEWEAPIWLPRSQIELEQLDDTEWRVAIAGWLARKNDIEEAS